MAQATLAVLHSPEFPQLFTEFLDSQIRAVDRVLLAHNTPALESCQFVHDDSCGSAAGLSCSKTATILNLSDEREYCAGHFLEVSRG